MKVRIFSEALSFHFKGTIMIAKAGEWWMTHGGKICLVVFVDPFDKEVPYLAIHRDDKNRSVELWHRLDGEANDIDRQMSYCRPEDLIKPAPECTGWDYVPEKWKPATFEDIKNGPVDCIFKCEEKEGWIRGRLLGFRWKHDCVMAMIEDMGLFSCCEVLDRS